MHYAHMIYDMTNVRRLTRAKWEPALDAPLQKVRPHPRRGSHAPGVLEARSKTELRDVQHEAVKAAIAEQLDVAWGRNSVARESLADAFAEIAFISIIKQA